MEKVLFHWESSESKIYKKKLRIEVLYKAITVWCYTDNWTEKKTFALNAKKFGLKPLAPITLNYIKFLPFNTLWLLL